jgi:hypothetical protein
LSNQLITVKTDSVIMNMRRAHTALSEAETAQEAKQVMDVAEAAEIYATRQKLGEEAIGIATSIKVQALRKLGTILEATPRAEARFEGGSRKPSNNNHPTLADMGLDKKTSMVAQQLAKLSDEAFEQVRTGHESVSQALAKVKADKAAAAALIEPVAEFWRDKRSVGPIRGSARASVGAPTTPAATTAPADDPDSEHAGADADELAANEAAARADALIIEQLLDSDDKLATAVAEIKRLNAELSVVKVSRDGFMNQCNQLVRRIKALQRQQAEAKA